MTFRSLENIHVYCEVNMEVNIERLWNSMLPLGEVRVLLEHEQSCFS